MSKPNSWLWGILPLLLALTLACQMPTYPAQTFLGQVTSRDVERARTFGSALPHPEEWEPEISIHTDRITVLLNHPQTNTMVYLDRRIYPHPYTEDELTRYYSPANFREVLLSHYQGVQAEAHCQDPQGKLRLYEFSAYSGDIAYFIRYWVHPKTKDRIEDVVLVFPPDQASMGDAVAQALFPGLSHCPP